MTERGRNSDRAHYVNGYDEVFQRATVFVSDEPYIGRVTYHGDNGKPFRVNIVQRRNPIGFRASLPGDKRK